MNDLNGTPSADRVHIGFFGRRNAGKSSVVNAVTGQELSIVNEKKGTTTDPVTKSMELLPLGPVVVIDTPGIDDEGSLGAQRVAKTRLILAKTDIAVLVVDGTEGKGREDLELEEELKRRKVPYLVAFNKSDLCAEKAFSEETVNSLWVSAKTGFNIGNLKEKIAALAKGAEQRDALLDGLLNGGDVIVMVTPIDGSAPKGRMILPQVRALRDALDEHAICVFTQPEQLEKTLETLKNPPALVITDSQAFGVVNRMLPESIPLTSFSILFARLKGVLETAVEGAARLSELKDGDVVLISEGCTHHRQCGDIGTEKLPGWIKKFSASDVKFEFTSGGGFPADLSGFALMLHCGGCMLNEREVERRRALAEDAGVPYCNYGIAIARMNGILKRSVAIFPEIAAVLGDA